MKILLSLFCLIPVFSFACDKCELIRQKVYENYEIVGDEYHSAVYEKPLKTSSKKVTYIVGKMMGYSDCIQIIDEILESN